MSNKDIIRRVDLLERDTEQKLAGIKDIAVKALEPVEAALEMRIARLDAAVTPFVNKSAAKIHRFANIKAENDARVKSELRSFLKSKTKVDKTIKLFEDESQYNQFINEASDMTYGAAGIGGRTAYDPVFVALRLANPMRGLSKQSATYGSSYQFRAKTGNAGATWGYNVQNNGAATTEETNIWQLTMQDLNVQFPIRTAVIDDIDGLESNVVSDLLVEFSQQEGQSMIRNNDQGATTLPYGGSNGLRGLNQYAGANATYTGGTTSVAAFGTSGMGPTSGLHSIATYDQKATNGVGKVNNVTYQDVINLIYALPPQYLALPGCSFMINNEMMGAIRGLVDANGTPIFTRTDPLVSNAIVGELLGFPVVINSYLDKPCGNGVLGTTSLYPMAFGVWQKAHHIIDSLETTLRRYEQTLPGFITFYAEKRVACSVVDPFAIVRYRSTASAS